MSSLRGLPSVDRLLRDPRLETVLHQYGRSMVTDVIRRVIAEAREDIAGHGDAIDEASLVDRVTRTAAAQATPSLRRVSALTVFISVVIGAGLAAIVHSVYLLGEAPNPFLGDKQEFYIARGQYSLGSTSYVGAIATDIVKRPFPGVHQADSLPGATGIVLDDLVAGAWALAIGHLLNATLL